MEKFVKPELPRGGDYHKFKVISTLKNGRHKVQFFTVKEFNEFKKSFFSIFNKTIDEISIYRIVKDGLEFLSKQKHSDYINSLTK